MTTIRLLFLSAWFPDRTAPLNGDFVERQALAVSDILPTAALHVTTDTKVTGGLFEVHHKQKDQLYEVIIYFKRRRFGLFNFFLYAAGYFIGYRDILRNHGRPDVIHGNIIYKGALIAYIFRLFTGIPFIISEHWTIYLNKKIAKKFRSKMLQYAVKRSSALVPVTHNLANALEGHGLSNKRTFIVPNVVDTDLFKRDNPYIPTKKMHLLHVSSMKEEHKNIRGIISAIRQLKAIRTDFVFTFAGNASSQQITYAREAGLTADEVIFTGELDHHTVAALMKQAHMLVMFSNIENLPCVILEALSCGLPVISTDVGGINEWLTPREGLLIERGNEESLLQAIIHIMEHYTDYDPAGLHSYAVSNFSKKAVSQSLINIYNSVVHHDSHG